MDTKDLIAIGIAAITLINSWCQFWVKERLFSKNTATSDAVLAIFKTRSGISFIAFTGVLSVASIWLLVAEVTSSAPLTRMSCFSIAVLTVLSVLNMVLVQSLFTLRRMSALKEKIDGVETMQWLM